MTPQSPAAWRADPGAAAYDEVRSRVLDAAERCVERRGLARVRIDEVASEAGCSRATVYRYFADKDELIRGVLVRRARRIARQVAKLMEGIDDPAELLVAGITKAVDAFRRDQYFESFYGPASAPATARIAGGSTAIHATVREALQPLFDLAEQRGRLRSDVTADEVTEWVILVTTALLTIPLPLERTIDDQERLLWHFLVPAVFA